MKFPHLSFFSGKRDGETSRAAIDLRPIAIPFDPEARAVHSARIKYRAANRDVSSRGESGMTLQQILADPGTSSWLKEAVKMAYEQDPVDALRDAQRLLKMLGERYTQIVNRDLVR